jgi:hypothetical protein
MSELSDHLLQSYHVITPAEWAVHLKDGLWMPQCTVLTRKNTWCKNPIFHGQVHSWWGESSTAIVRLEDWAIIEAGMCAMHSRLAAIERRRNGG